MISPTSHTKEWIRQQQEEIGAADPIILEKAIYALTLLDALASSGLEFLFKGGTALLLHLPTPLRLSIDIDIVTAESKEDIEKALTRLIPATPFLKWEEHIRGERGLPKRTHYKLRYTSPTQDRELVILLDVVYESNFLGHLEEKEIVTSFLEVESPVKVHLPRVESLLADKLTAFAPTTVGVPLTPQYSQQVVKQLFDVAQLFDISNDLEVIKSENLKSFQAEAAYRDFNGGYEAYLEDVIETSYQLCALDLKGAPTGNKEQTDLLRRGVTQLGNHLISVPFRLPQAKIAAAKAAHLAMVLSSNYEKNAISRFLPDQQNKLAAAAVDTKYQCLNRLKSFAPECFHYWVS